MARFGSLALVNPSRPGPPAVPKVTLEMIVNQLVSEGKYDEARLRLEQPLKLNPHNLALRQAYARICIKLGDLDAAMAAVEVRATDTNTRAREFLLLGMTHESLGRNPEAIDAYLEAKRLAPQQPTPYLNAARLLAIEARIEEAEDAMTEAIRRCPVGQAELRWRQATLLPAVYQSKEQLETCRKRFEERIESLRISPLKIEDPVGAIGAPSFFLTYQGLNNRELNKRVAETALRCAPSLKWTSPNFANHQRGEKLCVGFLSSQFRRHTVANVTVGVIESLPRENLEVIVLRPIGGEDEITHRIDGAADKVVTFPDSLKEARERIAQENLDVLIYTEIGMEPLPYALAFSRLAPVQCMGWGHPDTTGIPNVDYFLSASPFEPEDAADWYSEQVVLLDRLYCNLERTTFPAEPLPRSRFDLPEDAKLYLCPQNTFKLHPDFDAVLKAILADDPNGLILIPEGKSQNWDRITLARLGDTAERLRIIPRVSSEEFAGLLAMADCVIDPLYFTGGYTSYLCFGAGIPVVTWEGDFFRGRMTAGLCEQMEVWDLVARDAEEFVALAIRLANDATFAQRQRQAILENAPKLFNDVGAIEALGAALVTLAEKGPAR